MTNCAAKTARRLRLATATSVMCLCLAMAMPAIAADGTPTSFNIPAQPLVSALQAYSAKTGIDVVGDTASMKALHSAPVVGTFAPDRALQMLLQGSGLKIEAMNGTAARLVPVDQRSELLVPRAGTAVPTVRPLALPAALPEEIVVTGTRLRGIAPDSSPVVAVTRQQIDDSGRTTVEQFMRTIPQNYQAGVTQENFHVAGAAVDGTQQGSGLNLRGLGAAGDAGAVEWQAPGPQRPRLVRRRVDDSTKRGGKG